MDVPLGEPEKDEGNARVTKSVVKWPIGASRAEEDWRDIRLLNRQNIIADVSNLLFHNNYLSVK